MSQDKLYLLLELSSVLLNILFLYFLIKERRISWLFGILGSLLGALLFYFQHYYSEALLYGFYALIGLYGAYVWRRPSALLIHRIKRIWHLPILLVGALSTFFLGRFMSQFDADKTYYDAFSTVFAVFATFMEMYKVLSAWIYWIVLNLFSCWLYGSKGLWVYTGLMVVYTIMSIYGLRDWTRKYRAKKI